MHEEDARGNLEARDWNLAGSVLCHLRGEGCLGDESFMRNTRGAMSGASDRENCGHGGAVTVSCFSTVCRALLPWAVAGGVLFGGGVAAQQPSISPDECEAEDTIVTCTGDLSGGVVVDDGETDGEATGTYTKLEVNELTGNIETAAEDRHGIAFTSKGDIDLTVDTGRHSIITNGSESIGISAHSDGVGGDVTVDVTGNITTYGTDSGGINAVAERNFNPGSTGLSGGNVVVTVKGNITTEDGGGIGAESIVSRSAGAVGLPMNAGDVTVDVTGNISTKGSNGNGIKAEAFVNDVDGGNLTVTVTGNITTDGTNSRGIYALSSVIDGDGGDVTVTVTGNITTRGGCGTSGCSDGIYADTDAGNIDITLNGGTITSNHGAGVRFKDGATDPDEYNTLTISEGAAVTISGARNVLGGDGNETIDNYGTLTTLGRIDLGEGDNGFLNRKGATFISGGLVKLSHRFDSVSTDDVFSNAGNLSPGGARAVQTTELHGNFQNFMINDEDTQEKGVFTVTTGPEDSSDLLDVRGNATLTGTVRVVGAYAGTYTILSATGDLSGTFTGVNNTLFINRTLGYRDSDNDGRNDYVELSSTRNNKSFCDVAATANQRAVACHGLDSLPIVQAVADVGTEAQARAAYDALSGEVHASLKGALLDTGQRPVAAIHRRLTARGSQPDARTSTATVGDLSSLADGRSGFWMTGYGAWGQTKATSNTAQMDTDLAGGLLGIDRALGKHGRVGVLGGYSQTSVAQQARISSGSVETWSVGLYGGAEVGAARLRVGALYNGHSVTTGRTVRFTGYPPPPGASLGTLRCPELAGLWRGRLPVASPRAAAGAVCRRVPYPA